MPHSMDQYWENNRRVGWFGIKYLDNELGGIARSDLVLIGARSGCVDKYTQYFNGTEWKYIADYTPGEKVLQADMQTQKATLVEPLEYIKAPCSEWYVFKTVYGLDMKLSAEHDVLYKTDNGHFKKDTAKNIYQRHVSGTGFGQGIPTSFDYGGVGIDLSDIEIKLMLAVMADGYLIDKRCVFHIKKGRKKQELRKILDEYGQHYNWYDSKIDGYSDVAVKPPLPTKHFPADWYNCSKEQLQLICDNVLKWDGSESCGMKRWFTTSKQDADFIQFVFSACGYRAVIHTRDRCGRVRNVNGKDYYTHSIEYSVQITQRAFPSIRSKTTKTAWVEPCNDTKYCFRVPSGCLVLRRNDKIFVTGNSGKSSLARQIFAINNPLTTALFSLENFSDDAYAAEVRKAYAAETGIYIPMREWQMGEFIPNPEALAKAEQAVRATQETAHIFGRQPDYTIDKLKDDMVRCAVDGCTLLIIDHLDYLDRDNPNESDLSHVTEVMKKIRELQDIFKIAVVAFSHLRKPVGNTGDVIVPNENEFIGSSNKVKQATAVIMMAPGEKTDAAGNFETWCCIRKNRNGGINGTAAKLYFNKNKEQYCNYYDMYHINYMGTKVEKIPQTENNS